MFLVESGQSDLTTQCMAEEKGDSEERVDLRLLCLLLVLLRIIPPLHDATRGFVAVFHPNTKVFPSFRGTDRDSTRIRGGAGKYLGRPGRKQGTATKLWIFSTYSPRSSIHFLARCSNVCKPLKKIRSLSVQPGLRGRNDLRVGRKMATFQLIFQSREQVVVRRGHIRRIGWVINTLESQVGQFLLGCKCPVSRGIVVQEQDPLDDLPAAFFLQNVLQLHQ